MNTATDFERRRFSILRDYLSHMEEIIKSHAEHSQKYYRALEENPTAEQLFNEPRYIVEAMARIYRKNANDLNQALKETEKMILDTTTHRELDRLLDEKPFPGVIV